MIKTVDKKTEFYRRFYETFVDKGFGTLSKRDTELLVFDILSDLADLDSKSNYELSLLFHVSPAKIKNYRYERRLRYKPLDEKEIDRKFFEGLSKSLIKVNNASRWVVISIEDSFVREAIKAKLKELKHFSDTSFNTELITLDVEAFSALMSYYYENVKYDKKILDGLSDHARKIAEDKTGKITVKGLFKAFVEGAAKEGGKLTLDSLLSFITGGTADIPILISKIKGFFKE